MLFSERKLIALFGNPLKNGRENPEWVRENIVSINPPWPMTLGYGVALQTVHSIRVHKKVVSNYKRLWKNLATEARKEAKERFGFDGHSTAFYDDAVEKILREHGFLTWGGGFTVRLMREFNSLSHHSFGIAQDLDPKRNPYGSRRTTFPKRYDWCFKDAGWDMGKYWLRKPDPMHFEVNKLLSGDV